ncbi:zonular occludens toxin domain-containing protein [Acinetobacter guillouiae]|uniref:zonular occludens toxin domain-containing protein n=1 Tax=Acinetobacter guillouiae TaxID=106649 RepID=UPI0012502BE0|nr:zonular occludens toxin domain-containing protein [Acinetobacter guillouiae]
MIELLSATPGSGKSLKAVKKLLDLSRENVVNLKHNFFYAKAFFDKISNLKLEEYLDLILVTQGQGLERTSEIIFLDPDFFDFLKTEYFINVISNPQTDDIVNNFPPYYFERIALLNLIIENINVNENTKFQYFKPVRTLYTNIADLKLVQCRPLPPNCDWRKEPEGSYFAVDEAQLIKIFSDEAQGIDPIVKDLTIHRHKGYDFLFITQEPSFVHKYIRKLASHHTHLVNIFGWEQSMMLEWSVVQDAPNAIKSIARAENITRWRFPKEIYRLYKSTTINTRVKRIPKKIVICLVLAVIFFIVAMFLLLGAGKNPLVSTFTGNETPTTQESKKNESTSKQPDKSNPNQLPASSPTDTTQVQNQNENPASVPSPDTVVSSQPAYEVSDPFAFKPNITPNVVNSRTFSGCFCTKNSCSAYDQQGTKIDGIDKKVCKDLIQDSSRRPFDYFNTKTNQQTSPSQMQQVQSQATSNYAPNQQMANNQVEQHLQPRSL